MRGCVYKLCVCVCGAGGACVSVRGGGAWGCVFVRGFLCACVCACLCICMDVFVCLFVCFSINMTAFSKQLYYLSI